MGHAIWMPAPKSWAEDYAVFSGDVSRTDTAEDVQESPLSCVPASQCLYIVGKAPIGGSEQNADGTNKGAPLSQALG